MSKIISSEDDLQDIKKDDNIFLVDDIYIDSFTAIDEFNGILEGNGYSINGLDTYFIKSLGEDGVVRNVIFENVSFTNEKDLQFNSEYVKKGIIRNNFGVIKSVVVKNSEITPSECEKLRTGFITAINENKIVDCKVEDSVINEFGIAGVFSGICKGEIRNCSVRDVKIGGFRAGGISGVCQESTITECTVKNIEVSSTTFSGGICGFSRNKTTITNTQIANSKVFDSETSSGILGKAGKEDVVRGCSIVDCNITGNEISTGIIGKTRVSNITIKDSFIENSTIRGISKNADVNLFVYILNNNSVKVQNCFTTTVSVEGKNNAILSQLKLKDSYIEATVTGPKDSDILDSDRSYITISKKNSSDFTYCEVSESKDLETINPDDIVILTNDIHISEDLNITDIFHGIIKGNNYTIYGLDKSLFSWFTGKIKDITFKNCSVPFRVGYTFGWISKSGNGTIENVHIQNSDATNNKLCHKRVGSLIGNLDGGYIRSCDGQLQFTSTISKVGGLVGRTEHSTIKDCNVTADFESGGAAGIVYEASDCIIKDCQSHGTLKGIEHYCGGIVGKYIEKLLATWKNENSIKIKNCASDCTINSEGVIGGICGKSSISIHNCIFRGEICGEKCGGIVGECEDEIKSCINNGAIHSGLVSGGIVGISKNSKIKKCRNNGVITSKNYAAGIIAAETGYQASQTGVIEKSSNHGFINGEQLSGGLIANVESNVVIKDSYINAEIDTSNNIEMRTDNIVCESVYCIQQSAENPSIGQTTNADVTELEVILGI